MLRGKLKVAASVLAAATVSGGLAFAAIPGANGTITACYTRNAGLLQPQGSLRVVDSASQCRSNETALTWNQRGQPGLPGEDGVDGVDGVDGLPGLPGEDGIDGHDGATGAPGATGDQGPIGPAGAQGPAGPSGAGLTGAVREVGGHGYRVCHEEGPEVVGTSVTLSSPSTILADATVNIDTTQGYSNQVAIVELLSGSAVVASRRSPVVTVYREANDLSVWTWGLSVSGALVSEDGSIYTAAAGTYTVRLRLDIGDVSLCVATISTNGRSQLSYQAMAAA